MSHQQEQEEEGQGEQIRIVLKLSKECNDSSLQVPLKDAIAVPCHLKRQGLSTVVNHLLGRKTRTEKDDNDDESDSDNDKDDDDDDESALRPAMNFEFTVGPQNKLLRTSVEKEARRSGLSLEQAIVVTYFPAQKAPQLQGKSERLPDWISSMSLQENILCTATYDGSIHVFENKIKPTSSSSKDDKENGVTSESCVLERIHASVMAHGGPIQCLGMAKDDTKNALYMASGSTDHSLVVHRLDLDKRKVHRYANCQGHSASIGALDLWSSSSSMLLASGDWDGGLLIYNLLDEDGDDGGGIDDMDVVEDDDDVASSTKKKKKQKTAASSKSSSSLSTRALSPMISIQAHHGAKISGISWGNYEKRHNSSSTAAVEQLITASWDHSVKLWNVERRDCILTLNGSRVVSCMNTSPHSAGIIVTGHPDCTLRLWDVRTNNSQNTNNSKNDGVESSSSSSPVSIVSDSTSFRPSHRAWVSAVEWSPTNPYQLASTSHDGTVKLWDIRSSLPLHTVRTCDDDKSSSGKALCLAMGQLSTQQQDASRGTVDDTGSSSSSSRSYQMFAGGTDCVVKQFQM